MANKLGVRSLYGNIISMLFLGFLGAFMLLPLIYAVSNAFKPLDELFLFPPSFFVRKPTGQNFSMLWMIMSNSWVPFSRYLFNSLFYTIVGTIGHVLFATTAAYVLAKHEFPGRKLFFSIIIASLMFTPQVTNIPNYLVMTFLHWVDSPLSIIIPAFGYSLGLFLMKQFIEQMVPDPIIESARIEGASELRIVFTIVMPMVKPAWLTLTILSVQGLWSNPASAFIISEQFKTLPYALSQILQGGFARMGVGAAVSVFIMVVPITLFIIMQSRIVDTMAASGIKE
ncbi:carbohydrate ABC transporter permease [Paenibacillus sp. BC26]|uniref:carbohydrate ABC transporter permease n=1 Tax=Paenibacillus sp. BC26 TaxID=1881032 RepID=UPI0008ECF2C4|nr:carbohydrate ABC transporter permease [Paenibacillus sp. BC26]SFS74104.1 ABC-type glycerol-3-phosphate transport system, permease component [Paenibacillus sp. BC26]